jgi:hypothetical protein
MKFDLTEDPRRRSNTKNKAKLEAAKKVNSERKKYEYRVKNREQNTSLPSDRHEKGGSRTQSKYSLTR